MKKVLGAMLIVATIVLGGLAWNLQRQASELDDRVGVAEQRTQALDESVEQTRIEAEQNLMTLEAAEALQRQTQDAVSAESRRVADAEQQRLAAERTRDQAEQTIAASRASEEQAHIAAEQERRKRREEWQRFGSALRKCAPTDAAEWEFVVHLEFNRVDAASRETLSRLVGVLLANHGYQLTLEGTPGALTEEIQAYLSAAGIPKDQARFVRSDSPTVLRIRDTVL